MRRTRRMTTRLGVNLYKRHRSPAGIISHCVLPYFRSCLSYRDVEELMSERGVVLTSEAGRYWCRKPGHRYAHQRRRGKRAAETFFRKPLEGLEYVPRVIITDTPRSYGAAKREIPQGVDHGQHRHLSNRAGNSHQPTRQRKRRMHGFKSPGHAQRFLAAYGLIAQLFRPLRHRLPAPVYRQGMGQRCQVWRVVTGLAPAA
jgi:putative transposase